MAHSWRIEKQSLKYGSNPRYLRRSIDTSLRSLPFLERKHEEEEKRDELHLHRLAGFALVLCTCMYCVLKRKWIILISKRDVMTRSCIHHNVYLLWMGPTTIQIHWCLWSSLLNGQEHAGDGWMITDAWSSPPYRHLDGSMHRVSVTCCRYDDDRATWSFLAHTIGVRPVVLPFLVAWWLHRFLPTMHDMALFLEAS